MKHPKPGRKRRRSAVETLLIALLALLMVCLAAYIGLWYANRARIQGDEARYSALYARGRSAAATAGADPAPSGGAEYPKAPEGSEASEANDDKAASPDAGRPTKSAARDASASADAAMAAGETPVAPPGTATPRESAPTPPPRDDPPAASAAPSPAADVTAAPPARLPSSGADAPDFAAMPTVSDELLPTPQPDTLVMALPTAPPSQQSFDELLAFNPDTVGFLEIPDLLALPVVQRQNDNAFYLDHAFDGAEANEGTLFMDGMNRLVPEDDCLIIYGHNMKNDTMFGRLEAYEDAAFLRAHPLITFDTLYEYRRYVPFAAFTASMTPGAARYFDVRQFLFDGAGFDDFVRQLRRRSQHALNVDVRYGDRLLLLVTCDYTNDAGRFILALRQLRPDETESDVYDGFQN